MCEFLLKCFCCCCSGPHIRNGNASMECDNTANREGERVRDLSKASAIINHFGPFVCLEQMSIEQSAQFCLVCVCGEEYIFFLERPFSDAISTISSSHFILFHLPGPDFEKVLAPLYYYSNKSMYCNEWARGSSAWVSVKLYIWYKWMFNGFVHSFYARQVICNGNLALMHEFAEFMFSGCLIVRRVREDPTPTTRQ